MARNEDIENHLATCLNGGTNAIAGDQYLGIIYLILVTRLHENLSPSHECIICFEPFLKDERIARLNCMCVYHLSCIDDWFSRGKTCPVHYRTT